MTSVDRDVTKMAYRHEKRRARSKQSRPKQFCGIGLSRPASP